MWVTTHLFKPVIAFFMYLWSHHDGTTTLAATQGYNLSGSTLSTVILNNYTGFTHGISGLPVELTTKFLQSLSPETATGTDAKLNISSPTLLPPLRITTDESIKERSKPPSDTSTGAEINSGTAENNITTTESDFRFNGTTSEEPSEGNETHTTIDDFVNNSTDNDNETSPNNAKQPPPTTESSNFTTDSSNETTQPPLTTENSNFTTDTETPTESSQLPSNETSETPQFTVTPSVPSNETTQTEETTSHSPESTTEEPSGKKPLSKGAIAGIVIGSLLLLAVVAVAIIYVVKRKWQPGDERQRLTA